MTLGTSATPFSSRTTTGWPFSMYAARLKVVPRSMPMTEGELMHVVSRSMPVNPAVRATAQSRLNGYWREWQWALRDSNPRPPRCKHGATSH